MHGVTCDAIKIVLIENQKKRKDRLK